MLDVDTYCGLYTWDYPQSISKKNSEKSPGNLKILAVTQTPVRIHQQRLVWKNPQGANNNYNIDLDCELKKSKEY